MSRSSIYEFAGGEKAFLALADAHHERCLQDPVLNHPFTGPGLHPEHVQRLASYLGEVFGGPPAFTQTHGGSQSAMLTLHAHNGMGDEIGARFVACFVAAADDAGLPDDPEFRAALRSYMEWAVGDVLTYQAREARIGDGTPVPRWSWDGRVTS